MLPTPPSRSQGSKQSPADILQFVYLVLCLGGHSPIWGHRRILETFWLVESNPEAGSKGGVEQPHRLWVGPLPPWSRGHSPGPGPTRGPRGCCCPHGTPKALGGGRYPLTAPPRGSQAQRLLPQPGSPPLGRFFFVCSPEGEVTLPALVYRQASDSRLSLLSGARSTPPSPHGEGGGRAPPAVPFVSQPLGVHGCF